MKRWTLWPLGLQTHGPGRETNRPNYRSKDVRVKLMVHHFLPNADDRDVHDHPRPFWTFVLRGSYDDMRACERCKGTGQVEVFHGAFWGLGLERCTTCKGLGVVLRERMKAGMIRFRPASHAHRTKVGPNGCWTIVIMGPLHRRWGFWRAGEWFYWKDYERKFGFGMRCDQDG